MSKFYKSIMYLFLAIASLVAMCFVMVGSFMAMIIFIAPLPPTSTIPEWFVGFMIFVDMLVISWFVVKHRLWTTAFNARTEAMIERATKFEDLRPSPKDTPVNIAIDYDTVFCQDVDFGIALVELISNHAHRVGIVTRKSEGEDAKDVEFFAGVARCEAFYTFGQDPKEFFKDNDIKIQIWVE